MKGWRIIVEGYEVLTISILVGILTILIFSIIESLVVGSRSASKKMGSHIQMLHGETQKPLSQKIISNTENQYGMKKSNLILLVVFTCFMIFLLGLLIFKALFLAILISSIGLFLPKGIRSSEALKSRDVFDTQFRDALGSIVGSLKASLSLNSAVIKCVQDLERIHSSQKYKPVYHEFVRVVNDLNVGLSIDDALRGLSSRCRNEDVTDFVDSVIIVRQKGGDLIAVMQNVSAMISDKIAIKREINRLTAGKRFEAKILTFLPVVMILILSIISPSYIEPLTQNVLGQIFVVLCFIMLIINYFISKKIVDIKI